MFTRVWLKDTGERVVRTFAASLAAFFVGDVTVLNVDYSQALGVSATAALVTLLLSLAADRVGSPGTASFTKAIVPNPVEEVTR